jgi:hypothetical protein
VTAIISPGRGIVASLYRHNVHYLAAYLGAVTGCLRRHGMLIRAAQLAPNPQLLNCSITLSQLCQPFVSSAPTWVVYHACWDERHGWRCELCHIVGDRSTLRRFLTKPLVPAPSVVADFVVRLGCAQALGQSLGSAEPGAAYQHTEQELGDQLIRFIPTSTWIG